MIWILSRLPLVFLFNEFFFIANRGRLDRNFESKDVAAVRAVDLLYYLIRVVSMIWPIALLFCGNYLVGTAFLGLSLAKFFMYHANERAYRALAYAMPILHAVMYVSVMALGLIR